jgi:hypothetical protein
VDGGLVANGEFVVADGYRSVLLEQVDTAFDGVTLLVDLLVDRRWPSTRGALDLAVGGRT